MREKANVKNVTKQCSKDTCNIRGTQQRDLGWVDTERSRCWCSEFFSNANCQAGLGLARKEQEFTSPSVCLNMKKHMAMSPRCGWGITWRPVELYRDCSLRSASLCYLVTRHLFLRLLIAAALTSETILSEFPWGVHPEPNGREFHRIRRWEDNVTATLRNIFFSEPSCGWELSAF